MLHCDLEFNGHRWQYHAVSEITKGRHVVHGMSRSNSAYPHCYQCFLLRVRRYDVGDSSDVDLSLIYCHNPCPKSADLTRACLQAIGTFAVGCIVPPHVTLMSFLGSIASEMEGQVLMLLQQSKTSAPPVTIVPSYWKRPPVTRCVTTSACANQLATSRLFVQPLLLRSRLSVMHK